MIGQRPGRSLADIALPFLYDLQPNFPYNPINFTEF